MKKIVVVDDEFDIAEAVQSLLEGEGYRVTVYGDGVSALSGLLAAQEKPDLILVDMMMPRMDGVRLVESLRQNAAFQSVPIVMMSALRPRAAPQGGAPWSAFLQKPFAFGTLMRTVEKLVAAR